MKKGFIYLALCVIGLTFMACGTDETQKEYIEAGANYLAEQQYEKAIEAYEKVLLSEEESVEAYLGIAESYEAKGDPFFAAETLMFAYAKVDVADKGKIQTKFDELKNSYEEIETAVNDNYLGLDILMGEEFYKEFFHQGTDSNPTMQDNIASEEGNTTGNSNNNLSGDATDNSADNATDNSSSGNMLGDGAGDGGNVPGGNGIGNGTGSSGVEISEDKVYNRVQLFDVPLSSWNEGGLLSYIESNGILTDDSNGCKNYSLDAIGLDYGLIQANMIDILSGDLHVQCCKEEGYISWGIYDGSGMGKQYGCVTVLGEKLSDFVNSVSEGLYETLEAQGTVYLANGGEISKVNNQVNFFLDPMENGNYECAVMLGTSGGVITSINVIFFE